MNRDAIFLPVIAQVVLTLAVYIRLGVAKSRAARAGQVDESRRALHDDAWPDSIRQINNNIRNQFEVPVLFYAMALVLWAQDAVDLWTLVPAWLFVLSRIVHAAIHLGPNRVPIRRPAFMVGVFMVLLLVIRALVALGSS